jgi:uncharacterized protein YkwD
MTVRLALVGATMACGVALAAPAGAQGEGGSPQLKMLGAVNEVRTQHGLEALRGSRSLNRSARSYVRWMLRTDYFGHLGQIRASSRFSLLGENLAWHAGRRPRVSRTVRRWMQSPPHRALILHPRFRWLGAGMARGSLSGRRATAWVLHFGALLRAAGATAPADSVLGGQPPSEPTILSASPEIAATTSAAGASRASAAP